MKQISSIFFLLLISTSLSFAYDFSYTINNPSSSTADDYIVSTTNAVLKTEANYVYWKQDVGAATMDGAEPGTIIYHFALPKPVAEAKLYIRTTTFHWTYSKGHSFIYASTDGSNWIKLAEATPPVDNGDYNFQSYNDLLPSSFSGSKNIWLKVELNSYGSSASSGGAMTNTAQHSRHDIAQNGKTLQLDVNYQTIDVNQGITTNSGLIAYYPFNGNANDLSGNGHHGIEKNGVSYVAGKSDQAANFDGVDDFISIWNTEEINQYLNTSEGTVSVWFKVAAESSGSSSFIFQYYGGSSDRLYLDAENTTSSSSSLRLGVGDNHKLSVNKITTGIWNHAIATWTSDGKTKLFINGSQDIEGTYNPGFEFKGTEQFYFGRGWDGNKGYYAGAIDEVRIYNRALSDTEIQQLSQSGVIQDTAVCSEDHPELCETESSCLSTKAYWCDNICQESACPQPVIPDVVEIPADSNEERACECAHFDFSSNVMHIPSVTVGNETAWIDLSLTSVDPLLLSLTDYGFIENNTECADFQFDTNILTTPCLDLSPINLEVGLHLIAGTADFEIESFQAAEGEIVWDLENMLTQTLSPSVEDQTIDIGNYLSLTLPAGELNQSRSLSVSKVNNTPPFPFTDVDASQFLDISLSGKSTFDKEITLEFPFESLGSASGVPDDVGVMAAYWDDHAGAWRFVDKEVDRVNKVIRVRSNHLSLWSWMDSWNWESITSDSGVFNIFYDPDSRGAIISDQSLIPMDVKQFAEMLSTQLDESLLAYKNAGFKVPSKINVMMYRENVAPDYEAGWISEDAINFNYYQYDNLDKFRHIISHELFHAVQNRYGHYINFMYSQLWFTEAMADLAADLYLDYDSSQLPLLADNYFTYTFNYYDTNYPTHKYEVSQFISYLIREQGVDFKKLFDAVVNIDALQIHQDSIVLNTLDRVIREQTGKYLSFHWVNFVIKSHLSDSQLFESAEGRIGDIRGYPSKNEYVLRLKEGYTADVISIRTSSNSQVRRLVASSTNNIPAGHMVRLYRVTDFDNFSESNVSLIDILETGKSSPAFSLRNTDRLYIIGINSDGISASIKIDLKDFEPEPEPEPEPGPPIGNCPIGYDLSLDSAVHTDDGVGVGYWVNGSKCIYEFSIKYNGVYPIKGEYPYLNGELKGLVIDYYKGSPPGRVSYTQEWVDGVKEGNYTVYDESGNMTKCDVYEDGSRAYDRENSTWITCMP